MFELQVDVHVSRETYESLCAGAHNDWLTLTWRVRLATSYFLLTSTWRLEGRQEGGRVMEFGVECEFSKESALSVWCCQGIVQQWTGDQLGWLFIFSCVYGDFFFTLWNAHLLNFLRIEAVSFCSHFPSPREKKKKRRFSSLGNWNGMIEGGMWAGCVFRQVQLRLRTKLGIFLFCFNKN